MLCEKIRLSGRRDFYGLEILGGLGMEEQKEKRMGITTEYHNIREEGVKFPISDSVITNYMGINRVSVEGMSWSKLPDGQLISLTFHFLPNFESAFNAFHKSH